MKVDTFAGFAGTHLELIAVSEKASLAIPPLWPLSASVAVNPFLGQSDKSLTEVAALLHRVSGTSATMPRNWYAARLNDGTITDADLTAAATRAKTSAGGTDVDLRAFAQGPDDTLAPLPTVAHMAAEASGIDWPRLVADRVGAWAAGYFDKGQALWQTTPGRGVFESWQVFASRDLTPEIAGLTGFAATVAATPDRARTALALACDALEITPAAAPTYFHQLLLGLGGWSQLARQKLWEAELAGETNSMTTDMLTIRLIWEMALLAHYKDQIGPDWADVCHAHTMPLKASEAEIAGALLQDAAEHAAQRKLAQVLSSKSHDTTQGRPALQAAFCIDVRSEVFRRALESVDPGIQTVGFAGFFGLTTAHRDFASDVAEQRLPVLLTHGLTSTATAPDLVDKDHAARLAARAARAWGRFKLAAVSSFAFVEATGPVYAGKLVRDALGFDGGAAKAAPTPRFDDGLTIDDKIAAAGTILRAMSMTSNFAPLVLFVGHGANVVNNPHASALHCGACGGYSGEVNARLLAGLLNEPQVRAGLVSGGITIPADTVFLGGLHDTTTDNVTLFDMEACGPEHKAGIAQAQSWLTAARHLSTTERALRLPRAANGEQVAARSRDWAETRPEWALAGCNAFIAAPRARTRGKNLGGRAFLHDYDWTADDGFKVLELIVTAPVVVASWISLQYYGSVVASDIFGGGNKLLHNVTGGLGVVEGNGGLLRAGLPWQSVHDGVALQHDPLRLSVCIEAPAEALTDILSRHPQVRDLFDNRWLHLFQMDGSGHLAQRYVGDLTWAPANLDTEDTGARDAA